MFFSFQLKIQQSSISDGTFSSAPVAVLVGPCSQVLVVPAPLFLFLGRRKWPHDPSLCTSVSSVSSPPLINYPSSHYSPHNCVEFQLFAFCLPILPIHYLVYIPNPYPYPSLYSNCFLFGHSCRPMTFDSQISMQIPIDLRYLCTE